LQVTTATKAPTVSFHKGKPVIKRLLKADAFGIEVEGLCSRTLENCQHGVSYVSGGSGALSMELVRFFSSHSVPMLLMGG